MKLPFAFNMIRQKEKVTIEGIKFVLPLKAEISRCALAFADDISSLAARMLCS